MYTNLDQMLKTREELLFFYIKKKEFVTIVNIAHKVNNQDE
jgi:hypothetical protein